MIRPRSEGEWKSLSCFSLTLLSCENPLQRHLLWENESKERVLVTVTPQTCVQTVYLTYTQPKSFVLPYGIKIAMHNARLLRNKPLNRSKSHERVRKWTAVSSAYLRSCSETNIFSASSRRFTFWHNTAAEDCRSKFVSHWAQKRSVS